MTFEPHHSFMSFCFEVLFPYQAMLGKNSGFCHTQSTDTTTHKKKQTNKSSSERKIEAQNTLRVSYLTTSGGGLKVWNEVAMHNGGVCSYDEKASPFEKGKI